MKTASVAPTTENAPFNPHPQATMSGLRCASNRMIAAIPTVRRRFTTDEAVLTRLARWKWTAVAAIPTAATGVLEWGFGWPLSNAIRAVAAVSLGFAVAFVVVNAAATVHYD